MVAGDILDGLWSQNSLHYQLAEICVGLKVCNFTLLILVNNVGKVRMLTELL